MGDLAPMLLVSVFGETLFLCRYAVGLYAMALMFYFSTQDTLDALRCTSSVALGCISFLVLAIVFTYVRDPVIFDTVTLASSPATWFEGLPIMFSAYLCQFNIFKIKDELRPDQKKNINLIIRLAIPGIATTLYGTGGLLGYFMFGADVRQDLLTEFPSSKLFAVARGMLALTNMFKLPLSLIPLRMSFLEAVGFNPVGLNARKHIAFCLVLNLISFTTACTLGSLSKALGLSGCTAGVQASCVSDIWNHAAVFVAVCCKQTASNLRLGIRPSPESALGCWLWVAPLRASPLSYPCSSIGRRLDASPVYRL